MKRFLATMAATVLALSACGETVDEAELGVETDELTLTQQLLGAWKAIDGTMLGLVFAKEGKTRTFVAEQQVYCFRAPCHPVHLEGTWHLYKKLYLTEGGNKHAYEWSVKGDVLTLIDPSTKALVGHLKRVDTWCGRTADCDLQRWMHPMCVGHAVCTAGQGCGWSCGMQEPAGYGDACGAGGSCHTGLACESGSCWPK